MCSPTRLPGCCRWLFALPLHLALLVGEARFLEAVTAGATTTTNSFANSPWNIDFSGSNSWGVALEDAAEQTRLYDGPLKSEDLQVEKETDARATESPPEVQGGGATSLRSVKSSSRPSQLRGGKVADRNPVANFEKWGLAVVLAVAVAWLCATNDCTQRNFGILSRSAGEAGFWREASSDIASQRGRRKRHSSDSPQPQQHSRRSSSRRSEKSRRRRSGTGSLRTSASPSPEPRHPCLVGGRESTASPDLRRRPRPRLGAESDALERKGDLLAEVIREFDEREAALPKAESSMSQRRGSMTRGRESPFGFVGEDGGRNEEDESPISLSDLPTEQDYLRVLGSPMMARFLERREQLQQWMRAASDPFEDIKASARFDQGVSSLQTAAVFEQLMRTSRMPQRRSLAPPPSPSTPPPSPEGERHSPTPILGRPPTLSSRLRQRAYLKALSDLAQAREEEKLAVAEVDSLVGSVWAQAVNDLRDLGSVLGVLQGHALLMQVECVRLAVVSDLKAVAAVVEAERVDAIRDLTSSTRSPFKRLHCISYESVLCNLERAHQSLSRLRNPEGVRTERRRIEFVLGQLSSLIVRTRHLISALNVRWCELRCQERNAEDARLRRQDKEEKVSKMRRELRAIDPAVLEGSESLDTTGLLGVGSSGSGSLDSLRPSSPFDAQPGEALRQEELARRAEAAISRLAMKVEDLMQLQEALDRVIRDVRVLCPDEGGAAIFAQLAELKWLLYLLELQTRAPPPPALRTPSAETREVFFMPPPSSAVTAGSIGGFRNPTRIGPNPAAFIERTELTDSADEATHFVGNGATLKRRFIECQAELGRAVRGSRIIKLPTSDLLMDEVSWIVQAALGWIELDSA